MTLRGEHLGAIFGGLLLVGNTLYFFLGEGSEVVANSADIGGVILAVSLTVMFTRKT